jgi:hypothetical protein
LLRLLLLPLLCSWCCCRHCWDIRDMLLAALSSITLLLLLPPLTAVGGGAGRCLQWQLPATCRPLHHLQRRLLVPPRALAPPLPGLRARGWLHGCRLF